VNIEPLIGDAIPPCNTVAEALIFRGMEDAADTGRKTGGVVVAFLPSLPPEMNSTGGRYRASDRDAGPPCDTEAEGLILEEHAADTGGETGRGVGREGGREGGWRVRIILLEFDRGKGGGRKGDE